MNAAAAANLKSSMAHCSAIPQGVTCLFYGASWPHGLPSDTEELLCIVHSTKQACDHAAMQRLRWYTHCPGDARGQLCACCDVRGAERHGRDGHCCLGLAPYSKCEVPHGKLCLYNAKAVFTQVVLCAIIMSYYPSTQCNFHYATLQLSVRLQQSPAPLSSPGCPRRSLHKQSRHDFALAHP